MSTCISAYHSPFDNPFRSELCKVPAIWKALVDRKKNSGIMRRSHACRCYEIKCRSHDQLGQLDLQVHCNSQLVHQVFYGKCTRGGKIVGLIVATIYSAVAFIFCIYYNIFTNSHLYTSLLTAQRYISVLIYNT